MAITKEQRYRKIENALHRVQAHQTRLEGYSDRYSQSRLVVFIAGAVITFVAFHYLADELAWILFLSFIALFSLLVYLHNRVERSRLRHRLLLSRLEGHLARMRLDWKQIPPPPTEMERSSSYADELQLSGKESLQHLLDASSTLGGSRQLQSWLLSRQPEVETLRERHAVVQELIGETRLRERFALTVSLHLKPGEERWQGEELLTWLEKHPEKELAFRTLLRLGILAGFNIILFILYLMGTLPAFWLITFLIYFYLYTTRFWQLRSLFEHALHVQDSLQGLNPVFQFLEDYPSRKGSLYEKLAAPFLEAENRPSRYLRRIEWIAGAAATSQVNQILGLILNALMPWDLFFAYRFNEYRKKVSPLLHNWLKRIYEMDALFSLATFAYLHPHYIFPRFISADTTKNIFSVEGAGHPLISEEKKVRNNFQINNIGEVNIITGSNMSGKSTFLRTLAVNHCLANAGATVDALEFSTIPFRLFSCINVSDSLNEGLSFFYAEVRKLKHLLDVLRDEDPLPVFYVIDEIFRGTNNQERRIGSESYIQALAGSAGTGLISTHDLELVQLAQGNELITNYHFREEIHHGRMVFDYKIHTGPCPTTNALTIMRMEGLPVPEQAGAVNPDRI